MFIKQSDFYHYFLGTVMLLCPGGIIKFIWPFYKVALKRKHHAEASSHYNLCLEQLKGSEAQLKECEHALVECQESCTWVAHFPSYFATVSH